MISSAQATDASAASMCAASFVRDDRDGQLHARQCSSKGAAVSARRGRIITAWWMAAFPGRDLLQQGLIDLIRRMRRTRIPALAALLLAWAAFGHAQTVPAAPQPPAPQQLAAQPVLPTQKPPTRADILRGEYGRYRANNDLLFYHLDVRVDPAKKSIAGKNSIRFRMLKDDTRIQLDLYANLAVDRILLGAVPLTYEREINTVFVDFPETLKAGREYTIEFHYSGMPREQGRFGGMAFRKDPLGQGPGSTPPARVRAQASGGRTRISGATRSSGWRSAWPSPTTWWTCRTGSSSARRTWATATPDGTGSCSTRSTTTACRSTSAATCTSRTGSAICRSTSS